MLVASLLENESQIGDSHAAPEHVQDIMRDFLVDKAPNIDGVSNVIIHELTSCLATPLAFLSNLCLDSVKYSVV